MNFYEKEIVKFAVFKILDWESMRLREREIRKPLFEPTWQSIYRTLVTTRIHSPEPQCCRYENNAVDHIYIVTQI